MSNKLRTILLQIAVLIVCPVYICYCQNPNLTYFGYYHGDMEFDKKTHHGFVANNIDDMGKLNNCNVVIFSVWPGWYVENPDKFYERVQLAAKYKMKVLLNVYSVFFQWKKEKMQPDWQKRWANYKKLITPKITDKILGFYIDEPKQSGIKECDFRLATKRIRKDFPDKELISVISVFALRNNLPASYLEYCTGLGFDYYEGSWKEQDITQNPQKSYYALFEKFKTKIAPKQHLWLIPKAFRRIDFESKNKAIDDIKHWYKLAQNELRVKGILNFSFASYWAEYNPIGARQLFDENNTYYDENLKRVHINIGRKIISKKSKH